MMIDIGNDVILQCDDIISLLDINSVKTNKNFSSFLSKCRDNNTYIDKGLDYKKIKSYVITATEDKIFIYASSFTTKAIKERIII